MSGSRQLMLVALDLAAESSPSEAALRRSISTLYYAAFHRLMELCADALAPGMSGSTSWARLYRSLDHGTTRTRIALLAKTFPPLDQLGALYSDLMLNRQIADYDPTPFHMTQSDVLSSIEEVAQALVRLEDLTKPQRLAAAVELIVAKRNEEAARAK